MGGRQRGESVKYNVNPHTKNPNDSKSWLNRLLDPEQKGRELKLYK